MPGMLAIWTLWLQEVNFTSLKIFEELYIVSSVLGEEGFPVGVGQGPHNPEQNC